VHVHRHHLHRRSLFFAELPVEARRLLFAAPVRDVLDATSKVVHNRHVLVSLLVRGLVDAQRRGQSLLLPSCSRALILPGVPAVVLVALACRVSPRASASKVGLQELGLQEFGWANGNRLRAVLGRGLT